MIELASTDGVERLVRARSERSMDARLRIHAFVQSRLTTIRDRRLGPTAETRCVNDPVWVYWAQGERHMPPIVAACVRHLRRTTAAARLVVLDDRNLQTFVNLPASVYAKTFDNKTHFSDILRVSLLSRYGGIWMDATCLTMIDPRTIAPRGDSGDFLAFARAAHDEYMLSSWFMAASPGATIPRLLRNALLVYWDERESLEHYFLIHFLFEALYNLDAAFRRQWDERSPLDAYSAHQMQWRLLEPFNEREWAELVKASPVHKLTYKIDGRDPAGTFYDYITGL